MHSKIQNTDINSLFDSLKNIYQSKLDYMKGIELVFDYGQLLCCKCHETNLNRVGSYITFRG